MRSGPIQRAPSPTNTAFSGISSYRTEPYKPFRDKSSISSPPVDSYQVARTHYDELSKYLASYLAKEPANSRSTARQKLTRLTRQQFQELSTDVYDELLRRKANADSNQVPFLPVREEFHPKRNQARQKLATLPANRFRDLSSDVYYELVRRYPEFKEEPPDPSMTSPGSTYDDYPSPDFPTAPRDREREPPPLPPTRFGRTSEDRERPPSGNARPRRSQDDYNPPVVGRRSDDLYGEAGPNEPISDRDPFAPSRRKPSQDTTATARSQQQHDSGRRPSVASGSDSTGTTNAQSATVTSGIIIPNKSTIAEEDIEVPYGRGESAPEDGDGETDEVEGGLGALARRLGQDPDTDGGARSDDYYDKISFGRASVASDRSAQRVAGRVSTAPNDESEKMRRDYEFRIAKMQSRIVILEREIEDGDVRTRQLEQSDQRIRQLDDELDKFRRRADEQSAAMLTLQEELDHMREDAQRARDREARRAQQDEEELQILRERCERLEEDRASTADSEVVEQLRSDMEVLIAEVSDLSRRNDELMTSKDSDLTVIRDLDAQLKEYKRKYEQAKTELRSMKATSALFLQKPKFDDQLPVSADGAIPDVHLTAFLTAIDSLLSAGRSNAPTRVLTPMKSVVNAVTNILDDVRPHSQRQFDPEGVQALEERVEATLSNLVAASKTHATSSGLSPVSLLDAAASHVSAAVTELGRVVLLRRATKAEQEQFAPSSVGTATSGFTPGLRTVEEARPSVTHQRGASDASSSPRRSEWEREPARNDRDLPTHSESSSDDSSAAPTIFDKSTASAAGITSPDSAAAEGSEDAWTELRPYLEAQTESIIYAIQSVLSGVRSPTPSPTLNENLTQIITIVSSIVAVCHDNLPASHALQGGDILRELSEQANKLSEMQALPEVTKESRQVMAKSSFAIANAMKMLQKL